MFRITAPRTTRQLPSVDLPTRRPLHLRLRALSVLPTPVEPPRSSRSMSRRPTLLPDVLSNLYRRHRLYTPYQPVAAARITSTSYRRIIGDAAAAPSIAPRIKLLLTHCATVDQPAAHHSSYPSPTHTWDRCSQPRPVAHVPSARYDSSFPPGHPTCPTTTSSPLHCSICPPSTLSSTPRSCLLLTSWIFKPIAIQDFVVVVTFCYALHVLLSPLLLRTPTNSFRRPDSYPYPFERLPRSCTYYEMHCGIYLRIFACYVLCLELGYTLSCSRASR